MFTVCDTGYQYTVIEVLSFQMKYLSDRENQHIKYSKTAKFHLHRI